MAANIRGQARRSPTRARWALAAGLLALAAASCATASDRERAAAAQRERAFRLIDEGRRFEAQGAPLLALERYNRAALLYDSPRAWFEMGRLFEAQGEPTKAAAAYQQALRQAPDYQEAQFALLALGYAPEGYTPTAADLELARQRLQPRNENDATSPAQTVAAAPTPDADGPALGRLPTLAEVRAVLFAPGAEATAPPEPVPGGAPTADRELLLGTFEYHFRRAEQWRERGQTDRAAIEYQNAITADPSRIEGWLAMGDLMLRAERYPRAQYYYQRAMEEFPQSPEPPFKLGNYWLAVGDEAQARVQWHRALELDPRFVKAYNNLAYLAMKAGRYAEAAPLLDRVIELDPTYANAYLNRGIIAAESERDYRRAIELYREYVELGGERADEVRQAIAELEARLR